MICEDNYLIFSKDDLLTTWKVLPLCYASTISLVSLSLQLEKSFGTTSVEGQGKAGKVGKQVSLWELKSDNGGQGSEMRQKRETTQGRTGILHVQF